MSFSDSSEEVSTHHSIIKLKHDLIKQEVLCQIILVKDLPKLQSVVSTDA